MADVEGDFFVWNKTGIENVLNAWAFLDNAKTISLTTVVFMAVISPITVLGNLMVIIVIWKDPLKKLRSSPSNVIVMSMAIADLLVGLVVSPLVGYRHLSIVKEELTPLKIAFTITLTSLLVNVSIGHMFLLTIDRFIAVVTPLQYRVKVTRNTVRMAAAACWVYFLLFGSAHLVFLEHFLVMAAINSLQMLVSLFIILVLYIVIVWSFHRYSHKKVADLHHGSERNHQLSLQRERNLCKAIAIVIAAFLFCFMPWFIIQILSYNCRPCQSNFSLLMLILKLSNILVYSNSGLNPFLYAWRLPKYRETIKHLWKNRSSCCGTPEREVDDTNMYDTRL